MKKFVFILAAILILLVSSVGTAKGQTFSCVYPIGYNPWQTLTFGTTYNANVNLELNGPDHGGYMSTDYNHSGVTCASSSPYTTRIVIDGSALGNAFDFTDGVLYLHNRNTGAWTYIGPSINWSNNVAYREYTTPANNTYGIYFQANLNTNQAPSWCNSRKPVYTRLYAVINGQYQLMSEERKDFYFRC